MERIKTDELPRSPGPWQAVHPGPPPMKRPPWLNWLYLLIFLWSSWQLAGMWWQRLHG